MDTLLDSDIRIKFSFWPHGMKSGAPFSLRCEFCLWSYLQDMDIKTQKSVLHEEKGNALIGIIEEQEDHDYVIVHVESKRAVKKRIDYEVTVDDVKKFGFIPAHGTTTPNGSRPRFRPLRRDFKVGMVFNRIPEDWTDWKEWPSSVIKTMRLKVAAQAI